MDPEVGSAVGENVLEEGVSAPTPPTVLAEQEAHFLPVQLCPNSSAVLWQGQPQSISSWVAFLGTVEMVLYGHSATTGRLCAGADQLGQSQVGFHEEAFPSVHRVVMLSGNVSPSCFLVFHFMRLFKACCSYGKLNIGLENVWAVGSEVHQGLNRQNQHFSFC